jgi:hypothetical protein
MESLFKKIGTPKIRAAELEGCLYCGPAARLPSKRAEHLFNACWGGNHQTHRLICDACNAALSSIDGSFSPITTYVMNAWNFKGRRQKAVPSIPVGNGYMLTPGAKPELLEPLIEVERTEHEESFQLVVHSKREARRLVIPGGELEQRLGRKLTEEQRDEIYDSIRRMSSEGQPIGRVTGRMSLDLQAQYRSAAHTALKGLAMYAPLLVAGEWTAAVRRFARHGTGNWTDFARTVEPRVALSVEVASQHGVKFNALDVYWCREERMIVAVITILGRIKRGVLLCENVEVPDAGFCVFEAVDEAGPPSAFFWEMSNEMRQLPFVKVAPAPTRQRIAEDAIRIAKKSMERDPLVVDIGQRLAKLSEDPSLSGLRAAKACTEVCADAVEQLCRVRQRTVPRQRIFSELWKRIGRVLGTEAAGRAVFTDEGLRSVTRAFNAVVAELPGLHKQGEG